MPLLYRHLFPAMWLLWCLYWLIASANSKPSIRRESAWSRLSYSGLLVVAVLLFYAGPIAGLDARILPRSPVCFWIGAAITAGGLLFSVWARLHLSSNWSGTVTIKEGHELITSGPYAFARHPIYTGILFGFLGSAVALGEVRGLLAVLLAGLSFWRKLKIEERWLGETFGDAYTVYRRRVKALIPFVV